MRLKRFSLVLLIAGLCATGFIMLSLRSGVSRAQTGNGENMQKGLQFRLSEGSGAGTGESQPPAATASPLPAQQTDSLLARLKPLKSEESDQKEFALREGSLPAPRTGKVINAAFPPSESGGPVGAVAGGPLEVVRYAPEGDVPIAPHLSVTFSQPMVAVTSQEEAAATVPVKLTPEPPGKWRWIGTKTLLFEPDQRFPMATKYSVEVPAGTKSALGTTLEKAASWTFATPPPQVKATYPYQYGTQSRDPLMFVAFDQRIDPSAVLETIKLRAGGGTYSVRQAAAEDIASDKAVKTFSEQAQKGRWVAFRPVGKPGSQKGLVLPAAAKVAVVIGPGTPSAEGPIRTDKAQEFSFETFGPLRVTEHRCGYRGDCSPLDSWQISFSNALDENSFDSKLVRVEPALDGMKVVARGNWLTIDGLMKGRTKYTVTLDASIKDVFGQQLGESVSLTFNVGSAPPALAASKTGFVVLDPFGAPHYSVYSINHKSLKVRLYRVTPEDWPAFLSYMENSPGRFRRGVRQPGTPPGLQVFSKDIPVEAQADELVETSIDLTPALQNGFGQAVLVVEPDFVPKDYVWNNQPIVSWIQVTGIGLDASVDNTEMLAWATSLKDGKAIPDVQLTLLPDKSSAQTAADGTARFELRSESSNRSGMLVARKGNDVAILPESTYSYGYGAWARKPVKDLLRWYVFDDRGIYRPGEEVHVKGWIRLVGGGKDGDVGPLGDSASGLNFTLKDSRGNEIHKGSLQLNALGGFDTVLKLPDNMSLGYASLQLSAVGTPPTVMGEQDTLTFQVQEFRRPEFEVSASASEGPHFIGDHGEFTVKANYYAGGGLANAPVNWRVTSTPGYYTPPGRSDFTFGEWVPWWIFGGRPGGETQVQTFEGKTGFDGAHRLRIDFDSANPPRPYNVTAEASVTDVNRQAWSASASMLVHPADLYVGLRSPRTFVQPGEPLIVESIVTDLDGKAIPGRTIKMTAVLLDWKYEHGEWKQVETNPQNCEVTSTENPVRCTFQPKEGGTYKVTATIMDDKERRNQSSLTLWVFGGKTPPRRNVEEETATLIPDRKDYKPGDTAEILVQSPFYPADGLVTLRRSGIVSAEHFHMDGPSYTLKVPIKEAYIPNVYVQVELVGASERSSDQQSANSAGKPLPKRPAYAAGNLNLSVPPLERRLTVSAVPKDKALEPGGETSVDLEVKDANGKPVEGSEVALVVVDEAVLSLTNYKLEDPLSAFYAARNPDTTDYHSRANILLGNTRDLIAVNANQVISAQQVANMAMAPPPPAAKAMMMRAAPGGVAAGIAGGIRGGPPIRTRENFNALAFFAPSERTDADGHVSVTVKLPDNLTRYRVMAVAVAGDKQFGEGESSITARLPLMLRPSPPRFLNYGDKFELPVVVQNQTDSSMKVDVAVRATNAELTDGGGRSVTVPANDRVEVRFPVSAVRPGIARFQAAASSGKWSDAAEFQLPVWTPATTEAFATYGEIDKGGIEQPVRAPKDAIADFGGLEITTSSTQLQSLTDAVLYLQAYPFECSEQLSSRIIAVAELKDVLTAFHAEGLPKPEDMIAAVNRDIKRLQGMQNSDGGFGFWERDEKSWPYLSVHVAHALVRAKLKGFDVPSQMLDSAKTYLINIRRHIPHYYDDRSRWAIESYALYVRNLMGDRDAAQARALVNEAGLDRLSLESQGWLLSVMSGNALSAQTAASIRKNLNNRAEETAGAANFTDSYSDGEHLLLHSNRRTDAVILDALITDQPNSDLIPKIVRGLLAHRVAGHWSNTQENAFVLIAMDRYFNTYEKATPDFVARAWLGEGYAGEHAFKGRSTDSYQIDVPMKFLKNHPANQDLILAKDGTGRLYYRIGMRYAPENLDLKPADYGFAVERTYEAVDKPSDVTRDSNGTWHIKAGARVRVRIRMVAQSRRYHVALVDPMPAGFEAMNPELAVTGSIPTDPKEVQSMGRWWWWLRPWFEHQNMRDERVEAFTSLLWEGVYSYSYVARATTPGVFVVPPPKAEEMYSPETFGRGATDHVVIE